MSVTMKTHTDYDQPHLEELQRVAGKTFAKKQTLFKRGFSLVAGLLSLGCGLTLGVQKGSVVICLLLCCFGVALCGWSVFFYTISAWGAGRSMPKIRSSADFRFELDAVVVNQGQESAKYPYENCGWLYETAGNFYYLLVTGQGLIFDKANLHGGTADQLRALLEEKTGHKALWVGKKP